MQENGDKLKTQSVRCLQLFISSLAAFKKCDACVLTALHSRSCDAESGAGRFLHRGSLWYRGDRAACAVFDGCTEAALTYCLPASAGPCWVRGSQECEIAV